MRISNWSSNVCSSDLQFAALMLALGGWKQIGISTIEGARERSFFGIYTVKADAGLMVRQLENGTTLHGVQSLIPALQQVPMSYYARGSGIGDALSALPKLSGRLDRKSTRLNSSH